MILAVAQVLYDPSVVSYQQLLDVYWHQAITIILIIFQYSIIFDVNYEIDFLFLRDQNK